MRMTDVFEIVDNPNNVSCKKDVVGVFYCNEDYEKARVIAADVAALYDCTLFISKCRENEISLEELKAVLSEMSMAVFVVSRKFILEDNVAKNLVLRNAIAARVKLLPIQIEDGIEQLFDDNIGHFHLINMLSSDYKILVESYIKNCVNIYHMVGMSDEQIKISDQLFCGKGFVSYRKKNRAAMKKLISELRKYSSLRRLALWYDDSLQPGENYNDQIADELETSDFILFVVTPDLLEEGNYVLETEYVQAVNSGKSLIAVEMENVDMETFMMAYPKLKPVKINELDLAVAQIENVLRDGLFLPGNLVRTHMLADAFYDGMDTERNINLAMEMYMENAEAGYPYSMKKLSRFYEIGDIVPIDLQKANYWKSKALNEFYLLMKSTEGNELYSIADAVFDLADELMLYLTDNMTGLLSKDEYEETQKLLMIMQEALKILYSKVEVVSGKSNYGKLLLRAGQLALCSGNPDMAIQNFDKAYEQLQVVARSVGLNYYIKQSLDELDEGRIRAYRWEIIDKRECERTNVFEGTLDGDSFSQYEDVTGNYRITSYCCPRCSSPLYKTIFPKGKEPVLYLKDQGNKFIDPSRVFVCLCGCFYAAPRGMKLSEGLFARAVVVNDPSDKVEKERYSSWVSYFNKKGDLFAKRNE